LAESSHHTSRKRIRALIKTAGFKWRKAKVAHLLPCLVTQTPNFGNQIVVRNLLSSLFVYFMRDWADAASPTAKDWFSGVRSAHTARALARIHEAPERAWTLEDLAQEAGLSRAAFARNFSASVGSHRTPI
jgi:transcriptional regulator GlxA family with amidase domain